MAITSSCISSAGLMLPLPEAHSILILGKLAASTSTASSLHTTCMPVILVCAAQGHHPRSCHHSMTLVSQTAQSRVAVKRGASQKMSPTTLFPACPQTHCSPCLIPGPAPNPASICTPTPLPAPCSPCQSANPFWTHRSALVSEATPTFRKKNWSTFPEPSPRHTLTLCLQALAVTPMQQHLTTFEIDLWQMIVRLSTLMLRHSVLVSEPKHLSSSAALLQLHGMPQMGMIIGGPAQI